MELKYVYIHDFRTIKQQGFNFSSKEKFEFDSDINQLSINQKGWHGFENFFGGDIVNITAISGDNGAGKTSFMEILVGYLINVHSPSIFVIDNTVYYHNRFWQEKLVLYGSSADNYILKPYFPESENGSHLQKYLMDHFQFGFISNSFYQHLFHKNSWSLDYSTSNLIAHDLNRSKTNNSEIVQSQVLLHKQKDLQRQVILLNWLTDKEVDLPFEAGNVDYISFSFNSSALSQFIYETDTRILKWSYDRIEPYLNNLPQKFTCYLIEDENLLKEWMCACVFSFMIARGCVLSSEEFSMPASKNTIEDYLMVIGNLDYKPKRNHNGKISVPQCSLLIKAIGRLDIKGIKAEIDLYPGTIETYPLFFIENFRCKIDRSQVESLIHLQSPTSHGQEGMYYFNWGLSAGETAFLNILSKIKEFFSTDSTLRKDSQIKSCSDTVLLLLDEPTLHFHPEWERKLVEYLVEYVPILSQGKKVQIIFTTHSPLTIADLPKGNVIYLKKEGDQSIIVQDDDSMETFGGDISEIYANTFKLSDPFFSSFARRKFDEILAPLKDNRKNISEEEIGNMKNFINMIGDEVMRENLLEVLKTKENN